NRMVIFGGQASGSPFFMNDTWALSLTGTPSWVQLSPSGPLPPARFGHVAVYDPVRDRMLIQEGRNGMSIFNDLWALSFSGTPAWSQVAPTRPARQRFEGSGIYDAIRDRMLVVAGREFSIFLSKTYDEVWSLSLKVQPMWNQLNPGGTALGSRFFFNTVYEP